MTAKKNKIKLTVRYNGLAIDHLELPEGDYELGRSIDCDIQVSHPSIRRCHGKLTGDKQGWVYQDYKTKKVQSITDDSPVSLSEDLDLATEAYTTEGNTGDLSKAIKTFRHQRQLKTIYGFLIALGLIVGSVGTYSFIKWYGTPSDPNILLSQVRSKIVEFEKNKDRQAIEDYQKIGGFKDTDFRSQYGFCTGFLVAPNVVLTALHCMAGGDFLDVTSRFKVRTFDNKKFKPKRVLGFDANRDFLFLEVEGMESYGYLKFAPEYQVGQTVYTIGNAHGQGIAIRKGIMASETVDVNDSSISHIRYSAGASPGNSGGPLLDTRGRIVALVFAATGAENYNLGTPSGDLQRGFKSFVENKNKKVIDVVLKKLLNFNAHKFLRRQLLPYLSDYDQFPEMLQKINNLSLQFPAPMDFDESSKIILDEVNEKSKAVLNEIESYLKSKGEIILDWHSFLSKKTPVILYSQFDGSQNKFFKNDKKYYMRISGFIDSPGRKEYQEYLEVLSRENKFDFQAYGMNNQIDISKKTSEALFYLPRDTEKKKKSLEDLSQGSVYSQMKVSLEDKDIELRFDEFMKNYFSEKGALSGVYSSFIKPQSAKKFIINEIPRKPIVSWVKDGKGRSWKRFSTKVFELIHLYVYCLPLPKAQLCLARVFPVESDHRLKILEENFRQGVLAHFIENPYFWPPQDLVEFLKSDKNNGLRSLAGTEIRELKKSYLLKLSAFNLSLSIPKNIQSLRIQTGLFRGKKSKNQWTGFGAEWLTTSTKPQVCGIGVEPEGSQSNFILNFMRDSLKAKKLKDNDEKLEIPKVWTKKLTTKKGDAIQLYGYCAPLRENPIELGYYFVDFKRAKARRVFYK